MKELRCINCDRKLMDCDISVSKLVAKCKCGEFNKLDNGILTLDNKSKSKNVLDSYQNNLKLNKKNSGTVKKTG